MKQLSTNINTSTAPYEALYSNLSQQGPQPATS